MRHGKQGHALSRSASHRRAMLANMATSVLESERIQTTTVKAKEVRGLVERLITFAKRNDLHARRQVLRIVRKTSVVAKLFSAIGPRFSDRKGGYTRIIQIGQRRGDAAEMSILELVDRVVAAKEQTPKATGKEKKSAETAEAGSSAEKNETSAAE